MPPRDHQTSEYSRLIRSVTDVTDDTTTLGAITNMNRAHLTIAAVSLAAAIPLTRAHAETLIPRSMADKGQYYLLESKREGDIIRTLHKRIGVDSVGWTKCEINCKTRLMREIGYSEVGPKAIKSNPTKWFELVSGSSKSDLVNFVCK